MKKTILGLGLSLLLAGSAAAAEGSTAGGWKFTLAPYMWLSEIHGDVRIGDRSASPTVEFEDIFELMFDGDLIGGALHFEAQHDDRLALFLDVVGTHVDPGSSGQRGGTRGVKSSLFLTEVGGAYRILDHAIDDQRSFILEPLVGARWIHTKNEFTIETPGNLLVAPQELERESTDDIYEPFLGARFVVGLVGDLRFSFRGDVGGFGAGSDLSWQIIPLLLYDMGWSPIGKTMDIAAGYRLLDFDFEDGGTELDLQFRGPVLGGAIRF